MRFSHATGIFKVIFVKLFRVAQSASLRPGIRFLIWPDA